MRQGFGIGVNRAGMFASDLAELGGFPGAPGLAVVSGNLPGDQALLLTAVRVAQQAICYTLV